MLTLSTRAAAAITAISLALLAPALRAEAAPPTCTDTLTAWWPGDANADDVSGNGHHGVLGNGAGYAAGLENDAFDLSAGDDFVDVPDDPAWALPGPFTIHMWANASSFLTVANGLISQTQGGGEQNKWILWIGPNGQDLEFHLNGPPPYPTGGYLITGTYSFSTGVWYHLAVTRDGGGTYRVYVNGDEVGSGTAPMAIPDVANTLRIGDTAESFQQITFNGLLDEVQIHDAALTQPQLATIVASGTNPWCEICGDGGLDPGEECDDGNTADGDGCSATCELPSVPVLSPLAAAALLLGLLLAAAAALRPGRQTLRR